MLLSPCHLLLVLIPTGLKYALVPDFPISGILPTSVLTKRPARVATEEGGMELSRTNDK
jgi:hypothetical protein